MCPASLSCVSYSIDICTVAIKNIRNMHAVSTNQIADILHFNDNGNYVIKGQSERYIVIKFTSIQKTTVLKLIKML